jgi:hypothetical protein
VKLIDALAWTQLALDWMKADLFPRTLRWQIRWRVPKLVGEEALRVVARKLGELFSPHRWSSTASWITCSLSDANRVFDPLLEQHHEPIDDPKCFATAVLKDLVQHHSTRERLEP